jgi:hypothetical protein
MHLPAELYTYASAPSESSTIGVVVFVWWTDHRRPSTGAFLPPREYITLTLSLFLPGRLQISFHTPRSTSLASEATNVCGLDRRDIAQSLR